ncbi:MAG: DUF3179 domain-containing protein [Alphaproteobacteria bacterium]|nr:DUF3179 domain-containing protein [Alphaproteobacteria bacterium]
MSTQWPTVANMRRRLFVSSIAAGMLAERASADGRSAAALANAAITANDEARRAAISALIARGPETAAALIDLMLYFPDEGDMIAAALRRFSGRTTGTDWHGWMLWLEEHPSHRSFDGYDAFKIRLLSEIDPNFLDFTAADAPRTIRFEEIVWGGVLKDGIPALVSPQFIAAREADWLWDGELVFGVEIDGDVRAYPHRIMDWHEMANDTVGGVPVALAYCTLCGSGVLYETRIAGRDTPFEFGSSGLLYRSNKLMYDRQTHSLWNHFTARPVVGPLVGAGIELKTRPVAVARWMDWKKRHPDTRVLSLDTGYRRDYTPGRPYGTYFATPGLMFPTLTTDDRLAPKDIVYVIRSADGLRAWPMRIFNGGRVLNDTIGSRPIILIGDGRSETIRAYDRRDLRFVAAFDGSAAGPLALHDEAGTRWHVGEAELRADDGRRLPRLAGHNAFWFAFARFVGEAGSLYREPR